MREYKILALGILMVIVAPALFEFMNVFQFTAWMAVQVALILYSVSRIAKKNECKVKDMKKNNIKIEAK